MTCTRGDAAMRGGSARSAGWLRLAGVLVVLAGVLAMHVLATGHEPSPMAFAVAGGTHHGVTAGGGPHPSGAMPVVMGLAMGELGCGGACGDHVGGHAPGWPHTSSHLLDLCLAVLMTGALAVLLLLVGRSARVAHPAERDQALPAAAGTALRWRPRPLSLAQLCVLRT